MATGEAKAPVPYVPGAASPMRVTSRGFPRDSWSHGDFPAVTPVGIYSNTVFQYLCILRLRYLGIEPQVVIS